LSEDKRFAIKETADQAIKRLLQAEDGGLPTLTAEEVRPQMY
jgi:hypothetical protein